MRYHLTVAGSLSDLLARSFAPSDVCFDGSTTTLTVEVRDQAALVGLVDRIGDLGLELVAMNRANDTRADSGQPAPGEARGH